MNSKFRKYVAVLQNGGYPACSDEKTEEAIQAIEDLACLIEDFEKGRQKLKRESKSNYEQRTQ